jgi:hypothetical protein
MKELDIKWLQEYAEQEKRYKWGEQIKLLLTAYEDSQLEIEELKDFITKLQATKDRLDSYDKENTLEIEKLNKEIEELKKENLEIRDWKYVIDSPIDLDKLKELDLIKIKGKEYISKRIYNELEKDKKALVNNYSKVLGEFIPNDKIKAKIEEINKEMLNEENSLELFYRKKYCKEVLQSLLEKE